MVPQVSTRLRYSGLLVVASYVDQYDVFQHRDKPSLQKLHHRHGPTSTFVTEPRRLRCIEPRARKK